MSGNLCHQIEHHLYPDLPSNRLYEISVRVSEVCDKYDLPYTTGSFLLQYGKAWRTIAKLSLPNKYLRDTADDAPETRSERMFAELEPGFAGTDPATGRRGLKTAIATVRQWRRDKRADLARACRPRVPSASARGLCTHRYAVAFGRPPSRSRSWRVDRALSVGGCPTRQGSGPSVPPRPCPATSTHLRRSRRGSIRSRTAARFSPIRCGVTDLGNTMSPR